MEVHKDDANNSDDPVFKLIIADTTYLPTTYSIDEIIVRANDLPQGQYVFAGDYIPKYYKARTSTQISLYWYDLVKVRFKQLRITDQFYYHLHISPDSAAYWEGLKNYFDRQLGQFNNDLQVYSGACLDEPWWTTWGSMGRVRSQLLAPNLRGSFQFSNITAVQRPMSPSYMTAFLDSTKVPQLILDQYPLSDAVSHESSGESSLQNAWDWLIYAASENGSGLRAAVEVSVAVSDTAFVPVPWWF